MPIKNKWVPKTKMKWVPKIKNENVKKRVSFAIDNKSRITNVLKLTNTLGSNLSSVPSSSNSLADCSTHPIIVDSGCTKHMTGNLKLLCNFVEKYLGTVRFGNDQFAPIIGYGDLVQGNIMIKRVYYREGPQSYISSRDGENLNIMKAKGDPCILFDEIKEITKTSVDNNTFGLVLQRQKASDYDNSGPAPQLQNVSPSADTTTPSQEELDLLFGPLYDEFFTAGTLSVNKSSSPTDNSTQQDTQPTTNIHPSTEPITPTTTVHAEENNDNQAADTQFQQDDFINPFCTPVRDVAESSSRNIDNSNMHTFYQPHNSEY
ncbi:hypothetical protein Tco_1211060 [Tanacetum coccineum]